MAGAAKRAAVGGTQTGAAAPAPAPPPPALSTIFNRLTPDLYQQIADQLREGGGTDVVVGGQTYRINSPQWRTQIQASYPVRQPAQPTAGAPATPTYFGPGANAPAPETVALQQMAQIDPASEALRQQLAGSYGTPLTQAQAPNAAQLQSYLDIYRQLDPTSYAAMQGLGQQVGGDLALGSTLDPVTRMQIQQAVRGAQGARGNVYGTPQLVEEAMTTGQAGLALQQQRRQAAQSYLQSGVTPGAIGLSMYQQNLANLRAAQQGAQSYLGSGVTPYQAGAGYLGAAQGAAAAATAGGPTYQAGALGSPYSYMNPQAGNQMSQTANQWYQSMLYGQALSGPQKNRGGAALGGALTGAVSGGIAGATLAPASMGTSIPIGAALGGILGGASGYFS